MSNSAFHILTAREHFSRAKKRARFASIINFLSPERHQLLSLQEVTDLIKPKGESYRGVTTVHLDKIVGSEGRYQDFDNAFLPKVEHLRHRWQRVDAAHSSDTILPPVKLYEIGGAYFVRDGNHRVSVAKARGVMSIDAEVTLLTAEVKISAHDTQSAVKKKVIGYEASKIFSETDLGSILAKEELSFTETGRYDEILKHIEVHKYYLNMEKAEEIPFDEAARSWYLRLYRPIIQVAREYRILKRFPGRSESDLYVWMIRHWHFLKEKYGEGFPIEMAVRDFSSRFGKGKMVRLRELISHLSPWGR